MQAHTFEKYYYAMVVGTFLLPAAHWKIICFGMEKSNVSSVVPKDTTGAKRAELSYKTVKTMEDRSLVRIQLKTGRHHQIRVQLAHAGHPIVVIKNMAGTRRVIFHSDSAPTILVLSILLQKKKVVYEIAPSGAAFQQVSYE